MEHLTIRLFGSFQLLRGQRAVDYFESNKVRALFAYLAVETEHPHQRRKLAALIWPEIPESNALASLRYALSNLRKVIGDQKAHPPYLFITSQTIQFNAHSDHFLDSAVFERYANLAQQNPLDSVSLSKAAELYKGRFLEGFSIPDSLAFEEWLLLKRERYDQLAYKVFNKLASYYELIGDYENALAFAHRQIALDPWREEVHRLIMRCLYFSGQRSAALVQYENCRKILDADLDIPPSPDTVRLYESICDNTLSTPKSPPPFFLRSPNLALKSSIFVCREAPLSRTNDSLDLALMGQGQLLLISGCAGQGKTSLVQEFVRRALEAHPQLAAAWGDSRDYFGSGDPFLPFREILEMLTGQVEHRWEAGAITHDHARRMWRLTETCAQALVKHGSGLIGTFVSGKSLQERISFILREEPAWLPQLLALIDQKILPPIRRENILQQYSRVLIEISHHVPLIIFVDDLQWADQSSLDLFFYLSRKLTAGKILLIGAFRPVSGPSAVPGSSRALADMVNELQIHRPGILIDLDDFTGRRFIDAYIDQDPNQLGEDFRDDLYKYTHSHPLYTVEILFDMKERGDLVKNEAGAWVTSDSLDWDHLPSQVEAAIEKRLSHLPEDLLDILKTASVEGDRFTAEVLAEVHKVDEERVLTILRDELDHKYKLVQADSRRNLDGNRLTLYRFSHILFQKYLYGQMDAVERAELHEHVGEAMEQRYGEVLEEVAVPLAAHFEFAGHVVKALKYHKFAGNNALRFSDYEDALLHFQKALSLLKELPETADRSRDELDLLTLTSLPMMVLHGHASEEVGLLVDRMVMLLKDIPLELELFPLIHNLSAFYQLSGQHHKTLELLKKAEELARRSEQELFIRIVNWGYGASYLWLGDLEKGLLNLHKMFDYYDPKVHDQLRQNYGSNPDVTVAVWTSWALWLLGYPEQALTRGLLAVDRSNQLGDSGNQELALDFYIFLCFLNGRAKNINALFQDFQVLLEKTPSPFHCADFEILQGLHSIINGQTQGGINQMIRGIRGLQNIGMRCQLSMRKTLLAEAYINNEQWAKAASVIKEAEDLIEETQERFFQAETLRVKGMLMEKTGRTAEAERYYLEALALARSQHGKTLELRAAMSLACFWDGQGYTKEAYQTLAEVYNWFTEGFDTTDLLEARALLKALTQDQ